MVQDDTGPYKFISVIHVSAKPMTKQDAFGVLAQLPGTTFENGVLSNPFMPDKSFFAGLDKEVAVQIGGTILEQDLAPGQIPTHDIATAYTPGPLAGGAKPPAPPTELALAPGPVPVEKAAGQNPTADPGARADSAAQPAELSPYEQLIASWSSPEARKKEQEDRQKIVDKQAANNAAKALASQPSDIVAWNQG